MEQFAMDIARDKAMEMLDDEQKKGTGGFIVRVKIAQGISKEVTKRLCHSGDLIVGDRFFEDGFEAVIGPFRPHALIFDQKQKKVSEETFDRDSDLYTRIQRGQKYWKKGYSAGPEFLVYIPSLEKFGTVHVVRGALTAGMGQEFGKLMGKKVLISSQLYPPETSGNQWPIWKVEHVSDTYEAIPEDLYKEAVEQFNKPLNEIAGKAAGPER